MKLLLTEGSLGPTWITNDLNDPKELGSIDIEKFNERKIQAPVSSEDHLITIEAYRGYKVDPNRFYKVSSGPMFRYRTIVNGVVFRSDRDSINIPDDIFMNLVNSHILNFNIPYETD